MNKLPEDCFHLGVKVLLCDNVGKVLLLEKQHRIRGSYWDLPGGRLQKGETLMDTLRREVEEETGFRSLDQVFAVDMILTNIRIPTSVGEVGLILSIYRCNISASFAPRLSEEHTAFDWVSLSEAPQLLKDQYPASFLEKIVVSEKAINVVARD
jgi:8-oxo-dGTP pyrophosphatase MutT (NUDIX family)